MFRDNGRESFFRLDALIWTELREEPSFKATNDQEKNGKRELKHFQKSKFPFLISKTA